MLPPGRFFRPVAATLALLMALATASQASAQAGTRTISGEPTCASCRIVLDTIAVVGSLQDSVLIGDRVGGILVMQGDTIVVGASFLGSANMVFAPDGRLARTIGTSGEGPGELLRQNTMAIYDDRSVVVGQSGRLSIMDLQGSVSAEAPVSLQAAFRLTALPDGGLLYPFPRHSDQTTMRYEIFSPDLEIVRSFDPVDPSENELCSSCRGRSVAISVSNPGEFWAALPQAYQLERWSLTGEPVETLRVTTPWIGLEQGGDPPSSMVQDGVIRLGVPRETPRPSPRISDLDMDAQGLLWITGFATPEDWEPLEGGIPPGSPTDRPAHVVQWEAENQSHAMIEVIDPESGSLIARRRLEHLALGTSNGPHYYLKQQDEYGVISYVVMRARLVGR